MLPDCWVVGLGVTETLSLGGLVVVLLSFCSLRLRFSGLMFVCVVLIVL